MGGSELAMTASPLAVLDTLLEEGAFESVQLLVSQPAGPPWMDRLINDASRQRMRGTYDHGRCLQRAFQICPLQSNRALVVILTVRLSVCPARPMSSFRLITRRRFTLGAPAFSR